MIHDTGEDAHLWQEFALKMHLTDEHVEKFKLYYHMLVSTNDVHNLTAITDLKKVLADHFEDSLALGALVDCTELKAIADVGSGAGFPGLPLKIVFPHLKVVLIEVNHKKVEFLNSLAEKLALLDVEVVDLDWRTFLRKTSYAIDLFCARASLQPDELLRMFKPSSPYRDATLVYWAAVQWQPPAALVPYVVRDEPYMVDNKTRRLIFFKNR